VSLMWK